MNDSEIKIEPLKRIQISDPFELYSRFMECNREIILFVRHDDGKIIKGNTAASRAYDYSSDELSKLDIYDLRARKSIDNVWHQIESSREANVQFETTHIRKDGSTFPVEVSACAVTVNGEQILASIIRDISDRRQTSEALNQSETHYRSLFSSGSDAIFLTEFNDNGTYGRFIEVNDTSCRLFGYNKEEFAKMTPADIRPPETLHKLTEDSKDLSLKGDHVYETVQMAKDGRTFPVEMHAKLLNLDGKKMALVFLRDITERKFSELKRDVLIGNLKIALATMKTLRGILPICMECKKIRDDEGVWHRLEVYVTQRTDAQFSHGYCPVCAKKVWGGILR